MNKWIDQRGRQISVLGVAGLVFTFILFASGSSVEAAGTISLGSATSFGILSGAGTTNSGNSVLLGDLGNYPTGNYTNSGSLNLTGTNHFADSVTQSAQADLQVALSNVNSQTPTGTIPLELGGQTLTAGVYRASNIEPYYTMNGVLTLDGGGNPNAIFVIKGTRLSTTHDIANVKLINGAQSCNVYWSFVTAATEASVNLGSGTNFTGSILIDRNITVSPDVVVKGRLLSTSGTISTSFDYIYVPTCSSPTPTPTPSQTATSCGVSGPCSPAPTPSPTVTANPTPTPTPTVTAKPTPSPTPTLALPPQVPIKPKGFVATGGGELLKSKGSHLVYLARSTPLLISIPRISVKANLISLGLNKDGTLQVPTTGTVAGWFSGAPTPGEIGPAIIVGHVDWDGKLGVFYYLKELKKGDRITITRADHRIVTYSVAETLIVSKLNFPTEKVYGDLNFAGLRLITCGGKFDAKLKRHVDNVIVFAKMVN